MSASIWRGVIPAITTPFTVDDKVDHDFLGHHARRMLDAGCTGIVPLGSLGEAATLSFDEKLDVMRTLVDACKGRAPVIPGIAAMSTPEAVRLAKAAEQIGCAGMMVLPPYVYSTDWREMGAHMRSVIDATSLPCMLYNNPIAYKTDFSAVQMAELANVAMGANGWIAGLVNAFPEESVRLFELARDGGYAAAADLYQWFLPMLRLDTVPKFVQLIKLAQQCVDLGSERVRAPRLVVDGAERAAALAVIEQAIAHPVGR